MKQKILRYLLALSLLLGILGFSAAVPKDAGATGYGVDISACSYAGGYCIIQIFSYASGTARVDWYTNIYGYNAQQTVYYSLSYDRYYISKYIGNNQRADFFTIQCPGACFIEAVYVSW